MSKIIVQNKPFVLKPYGKKELSQEMGITVHVLNLWIKAIEDKVGKPIGNIYSAKQVQIIIDNYGIPGQIINEAA